MQCGLSYQRSYKKATIGRADAETRATTLDELRQFANSTYALRPYVWELLQTTALQLHHSDSPAAAVEFGRGFANVSDDCRRCLAKVAASIESK